MNKVKIPPLENWENLANEISDWTGKQQSHCFVSFLALTNNLESLFRACMSWYVEKDWKDIINTNGQILFHDISQEWIAFNNSDFGNSTKCFWANRMLRRRLKGSGSNEQTSANSENTFKIENVSCFYLLGSFSL